MEKNKMTKRDYFKILREAYPMDRANYQEVIAFIDHELELLDRKTEKSKNSPAKEANLVLMEAILNSMNPHQVYTVSEMIQNFPCCEGLSTSKVSSMLSHLLTDKRVTRIVEKRKPYYEKVVEGN
jgi:hypothetical protein